MSVAWASIRERIPSQMDDDCAGGGGVGLGGGAGGGGLGGGGVGGGDGGGGLGGGVDGGGHGTRWIQRGPQSPQSVPTASWEPPQSLDLLPGPPSSQTVSSAKSGA